MTNLFEIKIEQLDNLVKMTEFQTYLIAIIGAMFAGGINTLAGNGSAITLTILTEILGLTPNMANGTNRIGVFTQCTATSWVFYKNGKLNLSNTKKYVYPIFIGAIAGAILALNVSNEQFRAVFRFMMVFMLIAVLVKPKRWLRKTDTDFQPKWYIFCFDITFFWVLMYKSLIIFFRQGTKLFYNGTYFVW